MLAAIPTASDCNIWTGAIGADGYGRNRAELHRLLDSIIALSAEGSRLALDNLPPLPLTEQDHFRQRVRLLIQRWRNHGLEVDMTDVFYLDDHNDVAEYLDTHGWDTLTASTSDLFAAHRLAPRAENNDDRGSSPSPPT